MRVIVEYLICDELNVGGLSGMDEAAPDRYGMTRTDRRDDVCCVVVAKA